MEGEDLDTIYGADLNELPSDVWVDFERVVFFDMSGDSPVLWMLGTVFEA